MLAKCCRKRRFRRFQNGYFRPNPLPRRHAEFRLASAAVGGEPAHAGEIQSRDRAQTDLDVDRESNRPSSQSKRVRALARLSVRVVRF